MTRIILAGLRSFEGGDDNPGGWQNMINHDYIVQFWSSLATEAQGPAALEDTCSDPPWCHVSDDVVGSKRGEHLCHCEDAFPNEDGAPNGESIARWSHQSLVFLAQSGVGLAEDASRQNPVNSPLHQRSTTGQKITSQNIQKTSHNTPQHSTIWHNMT